VIDVAEHDDSRDAGLPPGLPQAERVLWQGKPDWRRLATRALHVKKLGIYFLLLLAVRQVLLWEGGTAAAEALASGARTLALGGLALGLLAGLAWLLARSATYTVTNRRVILSFGIALPMSVNLPYSRLEAAAVKEYADGSGDIALTPAAGSRLSRVVLWPHTRTFALGEARPALRALPSVADVAEVLADAMATEQKRRPRPETVAGGDAAARNNAETPSRGRAWLAYPTAPLAAAGGLAVFAVLGVALYQLAGGAGEEGNAEAVLAERALYFTDRDDGSVAVTDARNGALVDTLAPGTNGFVRSTLRGLARARRAVDAGDARPFALKRLESGRVLLVDPVTDREVDLYAFGHDNADDLARFLDGAPAARSEAGQGDVVAANQTAKEVRK